MMTEAEFRHWKRNPTPLPFGEVMFEILGNDVRAAATPVLALASKPGALMFIKFNLGLRPRYTPSIMRLDKGSMTIMRVEGVQHESVLDDKTYVTVNWNDVENIEYSKWTGSAVKVILKNNRNGLKILWLVWFNGRKFSSEGQYQNVEMHKMIASHWQGMFGGFV